MTGPLEEHFAKLAETLAKPQRESLEFESVCVWDTVADQPVRGLLLGVLHKWVSNPEDAEDVLQNCLSQLSIKGKYDPKDRGPTAFGAWLYGCLRNHARMFFRTQARKPQEADAPPAHPADSGDAAPTANLTDGGSAGRAIEGEIENEELLKLMAPRAREIWTRRLNGETDEEIAERLLLRQDHVRQIRSRAARDLEKMLGIPVNELLRKRRCPPARPNTI